MSNHGVRTILLTAGFFLSLAAIFQAVGVSESKGTGGESSLAFNTAGTWTMITFGGIEESRPVGRLNQVRFAAAWYGLARADSRSGGSEAVEFTSNTVAVLWFRPVSTEETRISFDAPVEAIAFDYSLDPVLEGPTAVFYDPSGLVIGRLLLDVSDSAFGDGSVSGDSAHGPHRFQRVEFVAPLGLGIARVEFEGAEAVVGHFALDNLAILDLELIFADGFETGTTENWDLTVGHAATPTPHDPSCDDITIGGIDWFGDDGIEIAPVTNTHPTARLTHKRTDLDWSYYYPNGPRLREAYFANGSVIPYGSYQPPIGRSIDILYAPGESAPFRASWHLYDDQLWGDFEIRFRFEYSGDGQTCEYVRTISRPLPPTITPTPTPTNTPT